MKRFMLSLGGIALALSLAMTTPACGGKASKEDCQKAADNMMKVQMEGALANVPEAAKEQAKKTAEEGAKKASEEWVKQCEGKLTSDQVNCVASAKKMDEFAKCAQQ